MTAPMKPDTPESAPCRRCAELEERWIRLGNYWGERFRKEHERAEAAERRCAELIADLVEVRRILHTDNAIEGAQQLMNDLARLKK